MMFRRWMVAPLLFLISSVSIADQTQIYDGVPHSPVRDQQQAEICWAYALSSLAEGLFQKDHGKDSVQLSPEYLGFYHIYFQFKNRLSYFRNKAKVIASTATDRKTLAKQQAINEAYGLFKDAHTPEGEAKQKRKALFQPDVGSAENSALTEVLVSGMVPFIRDGAPITTAEQEAQLEAAVKNFVGWYMLDESNLDLFKGKDADGINTSLFNALVTELAPIMGFRPFRPGDSFRFAGGTYTPRTFMSNYLRFDPRRFVALVSSEETHNASMQAVVQTLGLNIAVPIGLVLFGDQTQGKDVQTHVQDTGIFTTEWCESTDCKNDAGGHEVLAVNWVGDNEQNVITGLIVKNSWGLMGLDVNGQPTTHENERGFFEVTNDYLSQSTKAAISDSWDFVVPIEIANLYPQIKRE